MTGAEVRKLFLDYFEKKGHKVVASSSLVPQNDPTLLFTNAGMNQFKNIFTGVENRDYKRATTCQKCLRVSGKHNDLENVGRTARHHTFFEMLGNFSFGDYFKRDAIIFGWEFLTEVVGLDKDRLWVTIFDDDDEADTLWRELTPVPPERIIRCGEKDNFWAMGDTGPCGPCSEIHFDQGPGIYPCPDPENCGPECDCDRYLELWNLVFMQFERDASGTLNPLPKPSIDTGMGLERITSVVQGKLNNYDTDLFSPLIDFTANLAGTKYGASEDSDVSLRVIADHIRSAVFLIGDGILPSNEGRGYVLRRVMRRAMRHGRLLGFTEPFFHEVAGVVITSMEESYPDLADKRDYVAKVILHEEERFIRTLDRGLQLLESEVEKVEAAGSGVLPGEVIFRLYDTYGFPVDLTADIVVDRGIVLDEAGFEAEMEAQREKARSAWKGSGEEAVSSAYRELVEGGHRVTFTGYDLLENETEVKALIVDGSIVDEAAEGALVELILGESPFYGESGGQMGDTGVVTGEGFKVKVTTAQKPLDGLIVLHGEVTEGKASVGAKVHAKVKSGERFATAQNHSATHLMHAALQEVLGDHVKQAGSLVGPDRLRFDFSHFAPMTKEEIRKVEELVNVWAAKNDPISVSEENYDAAVKKGVKALFGEKYGDKVRVVKMGEVSAELCGGTHASSTGEIGLFKILSEAGVAAGVRRIEAATGERALSAMWDTEDKLDAVASALKSSPDEAAERIKKIQAAMREQEKEITSLRGQLASGTSRDILSEKREIAGVDVLAARAPVSDAKGIREFADTLRDRMKSGIFALGAEADGKAVLLVGVTADLTAKVKAGELIRPIAEVVGGRGGGKPELAQAGGSEPAKLDEALALFYDVVAKGLG
ncbi:MAG: alanine--tRNA ligase [Deltaproteobacteria bacterium]|nr:MAG: alanine--tRNA ligase [Deltaproteobacteria bacterium]